MGSGWNPVEWGAELRQALRSLLRRPGLTLAVALTLGLGVGANAAIFGVLDRVVLNPFPFEGGDRIGFLTLRDAQEGWQFAPFQEHIDLWRAESRTLDQVQVYRPISLRWQYGDEPVRVVDAAGVSHGMLSMMRAAPVIGRAFGVDDERAGAPPVVMIDESHWRSAMGADSSLVGSTMTIEGTPRVVVGIWPASARPSIEDEPELWIPLREGEELVRGAWSIVLGQRRPGVSEADVALDLQRMGHPPTDREPAGEPVLLEATGFTPDSFVQSLWVLFWGTLALGGVAALNSANLLLSRATDRTGELGVRMALGGGGIRLIRLFAAEAVLLTALGVVVASVVATLGNSIFLSLMPNVVGNLDSGTVATPRVLVWGGVLAVVLVAVCILIPASHVRSPEVRSLMNRDSGARGGSERRGRLRPALVAVQVALAVVVASGSALAFRSYHALSSIDPGFSVRDVVTFGLRPPEESYPDDEARAALYGRIVEALEARPEVNGVTTSGNPLFSAGMGQRIPVPVGWTGPMPGEDEIHASNSVLTNFFELLDVPVQGRMEEYVPGVSRPVVVNEAYVRRFGDVVGRPIRFPGDSIDYRVTGVVPDIRIRGLTDTPDRIQLWFGEARADDHFERFVVRTASPETTIAVIRDLVRDFDPSLAVNSTALGSRILEHQFARERFVALLLAALGTVTLLLAAAGVYGVVSLDVRRRTREVGIRIALGAASGRVVSRIVRSGMVSVLAGAAIGVVGAWFGVTLIESILFGVEARDPVSLLGGAASLVAIGALAAWLPARRATRVDPVMALRTE